MIMGFHFTKVKQFSMKFIDIKGIQKRFLLTRVKDVDLLWIRISGNVIHCMRLQSYITMYLYIMFFLLDNNIKGKNSFKKFITYKLKECFTFVSSRSWSSSRHFTYDAKILFCLHINHVALLTGIKKFILFSFLTFILRLMLMFRHKNRDNEINNLL